MRRSLGIEKSCAAYNKAKDERFLFAMKSVSKKDAAKRVDWKRLILCLVLPLAVGGLAALLTGESMQSYSELAQPPFSPPGIVFPIAWTALYLLMGISSYLVCDAPAPLALRKRAAVLYILQLFLNFVWPILFFKFQAYLAAFIWLLALLGLVIAMVLAFRRVSHAAAWLQLPYLLWVCFAAYLNCGVWLLNG